MTLKNDYTVSELLAQRDMLLHVYNHCDENQLSTEDIMQLLFNEISRLAQDVHHSTVGVSA